MVIIIFRDRIGYQSNSMTCWKHLSITEKLARWPHFLVLIHTAMVHLFTLGTSREGAYSRQGAYFFFEEQPIVQNKFLYGICYLQK